MGAYENYESEGNRYDAGILIRAVETFYKNNLKKSWRTLPCNSVCKCISERYCEDDDSITQYRINTVATNARMYLFVL